MSIAITIKLLLSSGEMPDLTDSESGDQEAEDRAVKAFGPPDDKRARMMKRPAQACPSMFSRMRRR